MEFGGYLCSGNIYLDEITVGTTSRNMKIYAANEISQNAWMYNQDGAYGILGYGPDSTFWNEYINTAGQATYSVSLASYSLNGTVDGTLGATSNSSVSNITLGSTGNIAEYAGLPSLQISANMSDFDLSEFGFGLVYQTDGADTSQYFANFTTEYPARFSTNFQGMGLPTEMYG